MARKSKSFDSEIYQKISMSDLILFAIASVLENKEVCTFERLVKECFSFFPKSFNLFPAQKGRRLERASLSAGGSLNTIGGQDPKWPDSRKIDRPLRTLRSKKLISGGPKRFFFLTKTGKKRAEEISKKFRQKRLIL